MRIFFYLPVATPWWFKEQLTPLLRALHGTAELHVMVAPLWRNTGVDADMLAPLSDLDGINWHIVDADDPDLFRTDGAAVEGLLDLVAQIAPDLTIARSSDFATPARFPGLVRFIMEGVVPPFDLESHPLVLEERPYRFGIMPEGQEAIADHCEAAFADIWPQAEPYRCSEFAQRWRTVLGLPVSRPILSVPLQYEHEENYFIAGSVLPTGVALVRHLIETLDEEIFLAVTDHPLNRRFVDRQDLHDLIYDHNERAALCCCDSVPGGATGLLAAHADAQFIEQSKSWSLAAYCGTPMIHMGDSETAPWLHATRLESPAARDWPAHPLPAPNAAAVRRWFAWHLGARMFHPQGMTLDRLMRLVTGTADAAMIADNAALLRTANRKAA